MPKAIGDVLDRIEAEQAIEMPEDGTSLDLLQAVYRNPSLPLNTRMRAAGLALQFEHAKLAVTAVVSEHDLAARLDKAIERSEAARNGKVIVNGGPEPRFIKRI